MKKVMLFFTLLLFCQSVNASISDEINSKFENTAKQGISADVYMQTSENANQEMRNVMGSMVSSYSMKIDNDDMYIRASMSMNDLPQNVTIEQREKIDTFSKLAFISKCKRSTNKCEFFMSWIVQCE